jgi:hypothetical protein
VKGIVLVALERYLIERHGEAAWEQIFDTAGPALSTQDPWVGPGTYPDKDLLTVIDVAAAHTGTDTSTLLRNLGNFSFAHIAARYGWAVAGHRDLRAFLGALERKVHPEVDRMSPGARTPDVRFTWTSETTFSVSYRSPRALCSYAEGMLLGVATHFGASLALAKVACAQAGAEHCRWEATIA